MCILKVMEHVYYVIDGQQRLNCIKQFHAGKIKLNKKFSGDKNAGNTYDKISNDDRHRFLNYNLPTHIVENYNDNQVRQLFSRLQRGKPLSLGERLNAMPGKNSY